jgi:hypothetical protein
MVKSEVIIIFKFFIKSYNLNLAIASTFSVSTHLIKLLPLDKEAVRASVDMSIVTEDYFFYDLFVETAKQCFKEEMH